MSEDEQILARTAYHESGHAVQIVVEGYAFKEVSIVPRGNLLGEVTGFNGPSKNVPLTVMYALGRIEIAGDIAQRMFDPEYVDQQGPESDDHGLAKLAFLVGQNDLEQANAYITRVESETAEAMDKNWDAVTALAEELLKSRTLGYGEAREIIDELLVGGDQN